MVVGPTPPPLHGTAAYVRMLLDAPALRERWEVLHVDTSDRRSLENLGRIDPTNVVLALRHLTSLVSALLRTRVHVVWIPVSQNAPAYARDALFILAAHAAGARVVTHLHGGWFRNFYDAAPAPLRWLVRFSSARVARAWVLGEGLRSVYQGLIGAERVRVVANGVPDPLIGVAQRAARAAGPMTVLHLGQLSAAKGVPELLEAAGRLRGEGIELRVVLAGSWVTRQDEVRIHDAIARAGLREAVELRGVVTGGAKEEVLAHADVFVLATRYAFEGQPLAILEAMAAGLPVVATPRGAIPDMVADGRSGILVPERDVEALAGALSRLAADPALRRRLGEESRRRWAAQFTAEHALARAAEVLEELRPA